MARIRFLNRQAAMEVVAPVVEKVDELLRKQHGASLGRNLAMYQSTTRGRGEAMTDARRL